MVRVEGGKGAGTMPVSLLGVDVVRCHGPIKSPLFRDSRNRTVDGTFRNAGIASDRNLVNAAVY